MKHNDVHLVKHIAGLIFNFLFYIRSCFCLASGTEEEGGDDNNREGLSHPILFLTPYTSLQLFYLPRFLSLNVMLLQYPFLYIILHQHSALSHLFRSKIYNFSTKLKSFWIKCWNKLTEKYFVNCVLLFYKKRFICQIPFNCT